MSCGIAHLSKLLDFTLKIFTCNFIGMNHRLNGTKIKKKHFKRTVNNSKKFRILNI